MHVPETRLSASADLMFTVTELTRSVKRLLEANFAEVWVEGEMSNVKYHTSGHLYFSLKDEGATLRAVMFRARASRLRFEARDGMKVRVQGQITLYEPQGSYQLSANVMEPVGVGELELAFRQMYERLEKEGLFDPAKKRPLPRHPRVVGIVTSQTGAAIRDLLSVLSRRAPHVHVVVRPCRVQGVGAAEEIVESIADFDAWGGADVLIVGRGGGSMEDLWAFNEEIVARAIRASKTPIISAVGHEVDTTIADFAADLRAPTPSAAAELVAPDRDSLLIDLDRSSRRLARGAVQNLRGRRERLILLAKSMAFRKPMELYRRRSQEIDVFADRLETALRNSLQRWGLQIANAGGKLDSLSPLGVLRRGYALCHDEAGHVIRDSSQVRVGEEVLVRLASGALECVTQKIRPAGDVPLNETRSGKDRQRR